MLLERDVGKSDPIIPEQPVDWEEKKHSEEAVEFRGLTAVVKSLCEKMNKSSK